MKKIYKFEPQDKKEIEQLHKNQYIKKLRTYDGINSRSIFNGEYMAAPGYIKLNNLLFDVLYSTDLSKSELKVFLYIIRHTTGYHKTTCIRHITLIAKKTRLDRKYVYQALEGLRKRKMIFEILIDNQRLIHINFIPSTWLDTEMTFDFEDEFTRLENNIADIKKRKAENQKATRQKMTPKKVWSDTLQSL